VRIIVACDIIIDPCGDIRVGNTPGVNRNFNTHLPVINPPPLLPLPPTHSNLFSAEFLSPITGPLILEVML